MKSLEQLQLEYFESLNSLNLEVFEESYEHFEKHRGYLEEFANSKNSRIAVYDIHKHNYLFYKNNLNHILGDGFANSNLEDSQYILSRIHPDDLKLIFTASIKANEHHQAQKKERKKDFQLHAEFRVLNLNNQYIRVIEQYRILELDQKGDMWLTLSMMDFSPYQKENKEVLYQLVDTKSNEFIHFETPTVETPLVKLSKRENEILGLVQKGQLSKEISDRLLISVHTVNTHRQNILKKLDVNNSIEAIGLVF